MNYKLKFDLAPLLEAYSTGGLKPLIREQLLLVKEDLWELLVADVEKALKKELDKPPEERPVANQVGLEVELPSKGKASIAVWEQRVFV